MSSVEVANVSAQGCWIFVDPTGRGWFLPLAVVPWFEEPTIRQLSPIVPQGRQSLSWPDLDVDLDLERIEPPASYPLVAARHQQVSSKLADLA